MIISKETILKLKFLAYKEVGNNFNQSVKHLEPIIDQLRLIEEKCGEKGIEITIKKL